MVVSADADVEVSCKGEFVSGAASVVDWVSSVVASEEGGVDVSTEARYSLISSGVANLHGCEDCVRAVEGGGAEEEDGWEEVDGEGDICELNLLIAAKAAASRGLVADEESS